MDAFQLFIAKDKKKKNQIIELLIPKAQVYNGNNKGF